MIELKYELIGIRAVDFMNRAKAVKTVVYKVTGTDVDSGISAHLFENVDLIILTTGEYRPFEELNENDVLTWAKASTHPNIEVVHAKKLELAIRNQRVQAKTSAPPDVDD